MATDVFFSCGTDTADLKTTANVTSVSGVFTLTAGQQDKIGLGDEFDYDTDNKKAYISGRTSDTVYTATTATGTTPSNVTAVAVNAIKRAFSSLSLGEAGASDASHLNTSDLVSNDFKLHLVCYKDGTDTTIVVVDGWTTDATRFIKIFTPVDTSEVGTSQRHNGNKGTGYIMNPSGDGHGIEMLTDFTLVEGIVITGVTGSSNEGVRLQANNCTFDSLIIHDLTDSSADGIFMTINQSSTTWTFTIQNCIIFNIERAGISNQASQQPETHNSNLFNNTIFNCATTVSSTSSGINASKGGKALINVNYDAQNNIVMNNDDDDFGEDPGTGTVDWSGNDNIGSDGTLTSVTSFTDSFDNRTATANNSPGAGDFVIFVNITGGTEDLHLQDGAENDARKNGIDLSAKFTKDIDGDTRSVIWDIGADENSIAADVTGVVILRRRREGN